MSKTLSIIGEYVEFIYCGCGCGKTTSKYMFNNNRYCRHKPKMFISGHQKIGIKLSEEHKQKVREGNKGKKRSYITKQNMSNSKKGEKNPNWSNNPTYNAVHLWINRNYKKSEYCEICNEKSSFIDLANITGVYDRDLKNWAYLCRSCHHLFDNISQKTVLTKAIKKYNRNKVISEFF